MEKELCQNIKLSENYYKTIGKSRTLNSLSKMDHMRFKYISKFLIGESILDVGAYNGEFLNICRNFGWTDIYGTEINDRNVSVANENLNLNIVRKDFLHGKLSSFSDSSIDTVVCMEVLEHLEDDIKGFHELLRVAQKRVIVTVPHMEKVRMQLCMHCHKYTPISGHLHELYNENSFKDYLPNSWKQIKVKPFGNVMTRILSNFFPHKLLPAFDVFCSIIIKRNNSWILYIFEKN